MKVGGDEATELSLQSNTRILAANLVDIIDDAILELKLPGITSVVYRKVAGLEDKPYTAKLPHAWMEGALHKLHIRKG